MERYHSLYWLYTILAPLFLGLIALVVIALPGDPSTGGMLIGLAVYLVIAIGCHIPQHDPRCPTRDPNF